MRNYTSFLLSALIIFCMSIELEAQCNLDATIEGQITLCQFDSTTTLSTQSFDSYQWYTFQGFDTVASAITGATGQTLNLEGAEEVNRDYFVKVTSDSCMEYSDTVSVEQIFYVVPEIESSEDVYFENGNLYLCEGDTGKLYYNYGSPLFWLKDGDTIANGVNPLSIQEGGNYTVVAAPEYCPEMIRTVNFTEILIDDCLSSVTAGDEVQTLSIYPNPVSDRININVPTTYSSMSIQIYDILGNRIYSMPLEAKASSLSTSFLSPGTYTIVWMVNGKVRSKTQMIKN